MSEISQRGFGAALKQRREELRLSLDDVAASTRIRKTYLHALEEENLHALPGAAYAVGFLRIYARQLGLPIEPLLSATMVNDREDGDRTILAAMSGDPSHRVKRKGKAISLLVLIFVILAVGIAGYYYLSKGRSAQIKQMPVAVELKPETPKPMPVVNPQAQTGVTQAPAAGPQPTAVQIVELPVLPAGGAVVRMLPVAGGVMKVTLDRQESREYQLQANQSLNWKVAGDLSCELSAPGLVRVWVGEQEVAVAEHQAFALKTAEQPGAKRQ